MTKKQQLLHKSLVRQLHISKRYAAYYKLNKDEYVELLQTHFGKETSKDLSIEQLIDLVDYMNFKKEELKVYNATLSTKSQQDYIKELWDKYADDTSEKALLEFIYRQTQKRYLHLHMIGKKEAQKVIPVLKKMAQQ